MRAALLGVVAIGAGLSLAVFGLVPQDELARIARLQLPGGDGMAPFGGGDGAGGRPLGRSRSLQTLPGAGGSPLVPELDGLPGLGGAGGAPLVPPLPRGQGLGGAGGAPLVPVVPPLPGPAGAGGLPLVPIQPVLPGLPGTGRSGEGAGGAGGAGVLLAELSEDEPARLRSDLDDLEATVEEQGQALDELSDQVAAKQELEARGEESRQDRLATYQDADEQLVAALRELEHGSSGLHLSSLGSIASELAAAAAEAEEWAHDAEAGAAGGAASAVSVAADALRRDDSFDAKLSLTVAVFQLREAQRLALQP